MLMRLFLSLSLSLSLCFAQTDTSARNSEAERYLNEAIDFAERAKESYETYNVDQPLWQSALRLGQQALSLEPNDLEIKLFLARSYSHVNWHIRAWETWLSYLELGGELNQIADPPSHELLFVQAGNELGFARYKNGDLQAALAIYLKILEILPTNPEALTWSGRIYLELGQAEQALPYWQELSRLTPNDEGVSYYLELAQEQQRFGQEASQAFQQGLNAYNANELNKALSFFEAAIIENEGFVQAYVWAGRTSLELERPEEAISYWQTVTDLDPSDERAAYFLQVSLDQQRWGAGATKAFYEGQALYSSGDVASAAKQFEKAAQLNLDYKDALVWTARSYQESAQVNKAITYWRLVINLDPEDRRAQYFLSVAEKELQYGNTAGKAFAEGVRNFELSNFENAETDFKRAVDAKADFSEAWGWLGRVYFTTAQYKEAASAYERALALDPDNEDYQFFSIEADRLAKTNE